MTDDMGKDIPMVCIAYNAGLAAWEGTRALYRYSSAHNPMRIQPNPIVVFIPSAEHSTPS